MYVQCVSCVQGIDNKTCDDDRKNVEKIEAEEKMWQSCLSNSSYHRVLK